MSESGLLSKFRALAMAMEPENLSQDGERSRKAMDQERKNLLRQWSVLEAQAGRRVSEAEVLA